MTNFAEKAAAAAHVSPDRLERLSGGDLSEVLLVRRPDGRLSVAKGGAAVAAEAAMLRALAGAEMPVPMVEGEMGDVLLLEHIPNDAVFSERAWGSIGEALRRLHARTGEAYGWPVDYRIGSVVLENRERSDWPAFWGEQRLAATAAILDRPQDNHTVDSLAAIAGMSRSRFSHHFTLAYDLSPKSFVQTARLASAARMLEGTDLPVKSIAASVGFASRSHFSRAFQAKFGLDPSAFRLSRQAQPVGPSAPTVSVLN